MSTRIGVAWTGWRIRSRTAFGFLSGAGSVGTGVIVAGLCTYLFLSVSARAVGPDRFAPISTFWALVFIVGPGLFLPMQQELGRVLAARRADRAGGNPATKALAISGVLVSVTVIGTCIAGPWLTSTLFAGSWALFAYFELTVLGFALVYVARGVLSGLGEFHDFGRLVVAESFIRLAVGAGMALSGVHSPGPYGAAIAIAPFVALALVTRFGRRLRMPPGPDTSWADMTKALGWLLVGSLLAQVLANAGPIAVQLLATSGQGRQAGRFLAALVIARISLFLFQAVQAVILPNLSALVAENRLDELRASVRRLTWVTGALVVACTAGALIAGPLVVRLMFGSRFSIGHTTMALLACASAIYILAAALNGAAIAVSGHHLTALAWLAGCTTFVIGTLLVDDLFLRVEVGYLAGSCAAATVLLVGLPRLTARHELTVDSALTVLNEPSFEP